jgi:hypothetical protein
MIHQLVNANEPGGVRDCSCTFSNVKTIRSFVLLASLAILSRKGSGSLEIQIFCKDLVCCQVLEAETSELLLHQRFFLYNRWREKGYGAHFLLERQFGVPASRTYPSTLPFEKASAQLWSNIRIATAPSLLQHWNAVTHSRSHEVSLQDEQ